MQCSTYANEVSFALHLEENGYECKCLYGVTVTVRRDKEQSGNDEVPLIVSPIYLVMYFLAFFFRLLFLYVVCLAVYESFVLYRGGTKESWASIKILTSPADSVSRLFESTLGLWRLRCPFIYYSLERKRRRLYQIRNKAEGDRGRREIQSDSGPLEASVAKEGGIFLGRRTIYI